MTANPVMLMARLKAKSGLEVRVARELRLLVDAANQQKACLELELLTSRDDPRVFLLVEHWRCEDDLHEHLERPLAAAFRIWAEGMLEAAPQVDIWQSSRSAQSVRPDGPAAEERKGETPLAAFGAQPEPDAEAASGIFAPAELAGIPLTNHFVRSATWEGMADEDGAVTPSLRDVYDKLAQGGVGLLITGHAFVSPEGRAGPWQMGVHDDSMRSGLERLVGAVHRAGSRIVLQLAHAGCNAAPQISGLAAMGPSAGVADRGGPCSAMSREDIRETALNFAKAAVRAQQAGFDGVQLHAAHGYLLSQFLSPAYNHREDDYGGSLENRARAVVETAQLVRDAVGDGYPLLVKLNAEDFREPGLTAEEAREVAARLAAAGVDAIELSGGTPGSGENMPLRTYGAKDGRAYYEEQAMAIREACGLPLILVGGLRELDQCRRLHEQGVADYLSLSRPLIREPGLVSRWRSGDTSPATCISCNGCLKAAIKGQGMYCVLDAS